MAWLAQDREDLPVMSALVQDAIVQAEDIAWQLRARRLVMMLTRYCHEEARPLRIRSALRIEDAIHLASRNWPRLQHAKGAPPLCLLSMELDDNLGLIVHFASHIDLRLSLDCVNLVLEDVTPSWPAQAVPDHRQ